MKSYQIILLTAIAITLSTSFSAKNTTTFWQNQLNSTMHFQAYAGTHTLMQVINKLIGIIVRGKVVCFTHCLVQLVMISKMHQMVCP